MERVGEALADAWPLADALAGGRVVADGCGRVADCDRRARFGLVVGSH